MDVAAFLVAAPVPRAGIRESRHADVPVTHGSEFTRPCILLYTMLVAALFALLLVDHYGIVIDEARQSVFY